MAHAALGRALLAQGRLRRAEAATRRALELLDPSDPLRPNVAGQLRRCERLSVLDERLPGFVRVAHKPADVNEILAFAELCFIKMQYATAVRLYAGAFEGATRLADDHERRHRYNAARAAILAGLGCSEDVPSPGRAERERWLRQARSWLRAELALLADRQDHGQAADRVLVRRWLSTWQVELAVPSLREHDESAGLSPAEPRNMVRCGASSTPFSNDRWITSRAYGSAGVNHAGQVIHPRRTIRDLEYGFAPWVREARRCR